MKQFDLLVFMGRFSPFHLGHKAVIDKALALSEHVLVLVGSANSSRTIRNPFTFEERCRMISNNYPFTTDGLWIRPLHDFLYNDNKWVNQVRLKVSNVVEELDLPPNAKIGLIGHSKDASSYYLKLFPTWGSVEAGNVEGISATPIREKFLFGSGLQELTSHLPVSSQDWLGGFMKTEAFEKLKAEYKLIQKYKDSWKSAPFPPTFVTVDALVVQSGHILMVERGAFPGKGLLALPGGFLNQEETLLSGAIRELREETRLKVPEPVLRGSVKSSKTFDDPNRSSRGRTITTTFLFDLGFATELPKVRGADDAAKAKWFPFENLNPRNIFEDHASQIDFFLDIF
jgi:bifunctional NMN adenylyltransferase/nudix hydrolase